MLDVLENKCLQGMCGVTRMHRWRNDEVRRRVCVRQKMSHTVDRRVLKRFRQVKRMSGEYLAKRVYKSDVEGRRDKCRPCTRWLDGVEKARSVSSLELSDAKVMELCKR